MEFNNQQPASKIFPVQEIDWLSLFAQQKFNFMSDPASLTSEVIRGLLDAAIDRCDPEILEYALMMGIEPNEVDENHKTLLMRCIDTDNGDLVTALVMTNKVDVNMGSALAGSPLIYAAMTDKLNAAEALLKSGKETLQIEMEGRDGQTALMVAFKRGNIPMANLLMDYNCRIPLLNRNGDTALHSLMRIL